MHEDLVLEKQSILLFEIATESTRVEIRVVAIGAAIFVNVFEVL